MDSWRMTSIYKFDRISCSVVKHSANFWSMRYCTQEKAHDYISMISGFYERRTCPCEPIDNISFGLYCMIY